MTTAGETRKIAKSPVDKSCAEEAIQKVEGNGKKVVVELPACLTYLVGLGLGLELLYAYVRALHSIPLLSSCVGTCSPIVDGDIAGSVGGVYSWYSFRDVIFSEYTMLAQTIPNVK
jgi:hypothetical protein